MSTRTVLLLTLLLFVWSGAPSEAQTAPDLSHEEAKAILTNMHYTDIVIGAVVRGGVGLIGGPNVAYVIAIGKFNGDAMDIRHESTMYYDKQEGWFFYAAEPDKIRLWTARGYIERTFQKPK